MAIALIIEDGTGVAGANSYRSLADAETFFEGRLNAAVWDAATEDLKNRALAQATRMIDARVQWVGIAVLNTQALGWPRYGVSYEGVPWPETSIHADIGDAVCELALSLLTSDRTADEASAGLKGIVLGKGAIEVEFDNSTESDVLPSIVHTALSAWTISTGGNRGQRPVVRS